jgi:HEAT repeat protein
MTADTSALIALLRSADNQQQQSAAEQLARMGSEAQPAALALVEACVADDEETRESCVAALEDLGPPPVGDLQKLTALLAHRSPDVAYWAATLLGRLQSEAGPAVDPLARALSEHAEMAVRQRAAWALGQMGPAAAGARGAIEQAAASDDSRLARLARKALDGL